ncbi:MAG TPA: DinB family protein [Thermoanaerobaculia bacterium]|nr:DinB family protein [Thermoanaerobaculia bacterium]
MDLSVQAALDQLAQARAQTLALVQPLSQEELDRAPAPGKWSVGEVLDHLFLAGNSIAASSRP